MTHPEVFKVVLFIMLYSNIVFSQSHVDVLQDFSGEELFEKIVFEYKPTNVLPYSQARDVMYSDIYNENDSVQCVYSGHTLHLPLGVDPSVHLYMDASPDGINTEHTYPRSKGSSEENGQPFSDLHHLFPTRLAVNISRSNFPFAEIIDDQTTSWFYNDKMELDKPAANIHAYSERVNGRFEPREDHKGNVARAIFYFFTMYKEFALSADPVFFESQRETLCNWHRQDPVDQKEWERTFKIASYQDDLPNPFVLDCSLASRTYCEDFQFECALLTPLQNIQESTLEVFPSPVRDYLNILLEGKNTVRILDIFGRQMLEKQFSDRTDIDFERFNSGFYFVQVGNQVVKIVK